MKTKIEKLVANTKCDIIPVENIIDMVNGYIECALWADSDEGTNPKVPNFTIDISVDNCMILINNFPDHFKRILEIGRNDVFQQIGHDLWLTSRGHGSGFLDYDAMANSPEHQKELNEISVDFYEFSSETMGSIGVVQSYGWFYIC